MNVDLSVVYYAELYAVDVTWFTCVADFFNSIFVAIMCSRWQQQVAC